MLDIILSLFAIALCLLITGIVWLNVWIESFRRGGMTFWRVRSARRVYCGGSFYRSSRNLS